MSGTLGRLVLARRSASVLPPPSRLACACASALTGRLALFEFTRTTSSWGAKVAGLNFGGAKVISSRTAWKTTDTARVIGRMSLVDGGGEAARLAEKPPLGGSALIGISGKCDRGKWRCAILMSRAPKGQPPGRGTA